MPDALIYVLLVFGHFITIILTAIAVYPIAYRRARSKLPSPPATPRALKKAYKEQRADLNQVLRRS